jgi:hypothetical protein
MRLLYSIRNCSEIAGTTNSIKSVRKAELLYPFPYYVRLVVEILKLPVATLSYFRGRERLRALKCA